MLKRENATLSLWGKLALVVTLIRAGLKIGGVSRQQWVHRMTVCHKCPIYDPWHRRCRPYDGAPQGCGCYVAFLALVKRPYARPGCWAKNHLPDSGLGWD